MQRHLSRSMPAIGFGQSMSNEVNAIHASGKLHQPVSNTTRQTQEAKKVKRR